MKKILSFLLLSTLVFAVSAQEISEKRELSIFRLNYYGAPPAPQYQDLEIKARIGNTSISVNVRSSGDEFTDRIFQETIVGIDAEIRQVFQNLGRFTILSFPQRLDSDSLSVFIDAVRGYREDQVEIPEAVRLGQEAFTEQDLNRLASSFIIVAPTVTYYHLEKDESLDWEAEVYTNFSIVNVENYQTIADFSVQSSGYSDTPQEAMRSAVDSIAGQLEYQIRSIEEFRIRSAILERNGNQIIIHLGSNMGIRVGEEYEVTHFRELGSITVAERGALLRIREVGADYSIAEIIFEDSFSGVGAQVTEVPRSGADIVPYVATLMNPASFGLESLAFGLKAIPSRGFYALRPLVGFELIFSSASSGGQVIGVPISINFGMEYNLFLRRFRFSPQVYGGLIGQVPVDEDVDFELRGMKVGALLSSSLILPAADDNLEIYVEGGYELQFGLSGYSNVQGYLIGAGLRIR